MNQYLMKVEQTQTQPKNEKKTKDIKELLSEHTSSSDGIIFLEIKYYKYQR